MVLQNHIRWIGRDDDTQTKIMTNITVPQQTQLQNLLGMIAPGSTRQLQAQPSDVSVDCNGLPTLNFLLQGDSSAAEPAMNLRDDLQPEADVETEEPAHEPPFVFCDFEDLLPIPSTKKKIKEEIMEKKKTPRLTKTKQNQMGQW